MAGALRSIVVGTLLANAVSTLVDGAASAFVTPALNALDASEGSKPRPSAPPAPPSAKLSPWNGLRNSVVMAAVLVWVAFFIVWAAGESWKTALAGPLACAQDGEICLAEARISG